MHERLYTNTAACFWFSSEDFLWIPDLTDFYYFYFLFPEHGLGAMNGFLFFTLSFLGYSKRQISFQGRPVLPPNAHAEEKTGTRGICPSRDTQRYHFGRVASQQRESDRLRQWRGIQKSDGKVARLSVSS
ncbi:hypothetical protein CCMA1212_000399 [Trichoderma ghanense]|uniref:Uncharacterized protein n=1 Tax=Trichoderma ghanense TaxID=65468 RepID=A0ABY2HID7_9HYPO